MTSKSKVTKPGDLLAGEASTNKAIARAIKIFFKTLFVRNGRVN